MVKKKMGVTKGKKDLTWWLAVAFVLFGAYLVFTVFNDGGEKPQCVSGQERCVQQMYQACGEDGVWDNFGLVDGKCGYPSDTKLPSGSSCVDDLQCQSGKCAFFQCT